MKSSESDVQTYLESKTKL